MKPIILILILLLIILILGLEPLPNNIYNFQIRLPVCRLLSFMGKLVL